MPAHTTHIPAKPPGAQGVHSAETGSSGFVPADMLSYTAHFWWFVFLLMAAGGLAGWLLHFSIPPVYEAVGRFSSSIDYVSTGPMTQLEEDTALNAIGDLVYSDTVTKRVVERASEQGIQLDVASLKKMAVLERKVDVWELRVRSTDPLTAERIGNLWVDQGQAVLRDSYQHAIQAALLEGYVHSLEGCLSQAAASEPVNFLCSRYRFADIQADLREAGKALYQERMASNRLFSGLTIGPADQAVLSPDPVQFRVNQMVLAGAVVGFLLGVWLVQLGIPARWLKK